MRLLQRIAVLLKADAHGVVESLEERSLLLKQYLREAEIALDRDRARLDALREESRCLGEALDRERAAVAALDEDVVLALEAGKEELARFAIRRLLPRRREADELAAQLEQRAAQIATAAERLEERRQRFEELAARVGAERCGAAPLAAPWLDRAPVAEEEVEIELMRRRGAGAPGERS